MEAILLATQQDPQIDWTATQKRVNYDVFAQAPLQSGQKQGWCPRNLSVKYDKARITEIRETTPQSY